MNAMIDDPLKTVPFKVTNPERIPNARYYDEEFFRLENERLWTRTWQLACRLEEVPEVGDFVEYKILDKSVIVVRTKTGIKAFQNHCRHRGVQLASGHGNCKTQGFICPFHGWRWNMDGENTFVFGREKFSEENLDKAELNLVPCRHELWGGCVFINLDDDALPFADHIAPSASRLDPRNIEKMKLDWWRSYIVPTNWKLAMEAFMEGYHVMRTHPQLFSSFTPSNAGKYGSDKAEGPTSKAQMAVREQVETSIHHLHLLSDGMDGMISKSDVAIAESLRDMDLPDDPAQAMKIFFGRLNDEIVSQGRARGIDVPDLNKLAMEGTASPVEYIFPHYFLLPQFGNAAAYRIRPLTPETCLFELFSLTLFPEDEVRPRPTAPEPGPLDGPDVPPIPLQDYANLPLQQLGLHSKGFEYMRLSKDVEGMISNYQRLIDGYLGGVDKEKLAKGSQVASSGLDVPIYDIGF